MRLEQLSKLLKFIDLVSRPQGAKVSDLCAHLAADRSTVYRYKSRLEASGDVPYVPNPFGPHPQTTADWSGFQRRLLPHALWSALNFTSFHGRPSSVLVFVSEKIEQYAKAFLDLLDEWSTLQLPYEFVPPSGQYKPLWDACTDSCADYFGSDSYEYRLLVRGVVLHHGKMPGLMARLLLRVIDAKVVRIVVATATLTDGVNLPFETILIPRLTRGFGPTIAPISHREFGNLAGRAGRPGNGIEGRCLTLMDDTLRTSSNQRERWYFGVVTRDFEPLVEKLVKSEPESAGSALLRLLAGLFKAWQDATGLESRADFDSWLEMTAPDFQDKNVEAALGEDAATYLDLLDGLLNAAISEAESALGDTMSPTDIEDALRIVWRGTYAHWISQATERWETTFVQRGIALHAQEESSPIKRRRIYRTSLTPREAQVLMAAQSDIVEHLRSGSDYQDIPSTGQLLFIERAIELVGSVPTLSVKEGRKVGRGVTPWADILHWWLSPMTAPKTPGVGSRAAWHSFVAQEFVYKFSWGLGSVLGLLIDQQDDSPMEAASGSTAIDFLNDDAWSQLGIPWIAYWLKELITWGTLNPLVAALLSARVVNTRDAAASLASGYVGPTGDPAEHFAPQRIREWIEGLQTPEDFAGASPIIVSEFKVTNLPEIAQRVLPYLNGSRLDWVTIRGEPIASGPLPPDWESQYFDTHDFFLTPHGQIESEKYA